LATKEAAMFEDLEPRPARGAPLIALTREDLDGYSVEDLKQRIAGLEAEIARSRPPSMASPHNATPPTPCSISAPESDGWHNRCRRDGSGAHRAGRDTDARTLMSLVEFMPTDDTLL
jgi:uncharacterized small protein (DUF1192 family)